MLKYGRWQNSIWDMIVLLRLVTHARMRSTESDSLEISGFCQVATLGRMRKSRIA